MHESGFWIDKFKKGIADSAAPINKARLSLELYNKAIDQYNEGAVKKAIYQREYNRTKKQGAYEFLEFANSDDAQQLLAEANRGLSTDTTMSDYGITPNISGRHQVFSADSVGGKIELSIKSDVPVSVDKNTSGITPSIGSTMKPLY